MVYSFLVRQLLNGTTVQASILVWNPVAKEYDYAVIEGTIVGSFSHGGLDRYTLYLSLPVIISLEGELEKTSNFITVSAETITNIILDLR